MESGTTYEKRQSRNSNMEVVHRKFCQCPKCKKRIYNNAPNFQDAMEKVIKERRVYSTYFKSDRMCFAMSQDKVFTEIKSVIDDLYANNQKNCIKYVIRK